MNGREKKYSTHTFDDCEQLKEHLKGQEKELHKFKSIFNYLPDAIFVHDLNGKFLDINEAACVKLGYSRDELLNMNPEDLYIPSHHIGNAIDFILEKLKNEPVVFEAIHQHKDGQQFTMEIHSKLFSYNNSKAILSIARDITKRKQTEDSLKLEGETLKGIINNSPALIFLKDTNSKYTFINEHFKKYFPDVTGKTDFFLFNNKTAATIRNVDKQVLSTGSVIITEDRIPQEGVDHIYYTIKFPVKNKDGKSTSLCGISLDISHLKKSEDALKKSKKELALLNKTKDRLFSIIAHDLRNPFHQIIGFSELLLEDFNSFDHQETKDMIKTIYTVAQNTNNLLSNLLEWSRIQSQGLKLQLERFELTSAIFDVILLYDNICQDKHISVRNTIPPGLQIHADKQMIQTIIRNLVGNAIKYTPERGIINISHQITPSCIEIAVKDNGEGMSAKMVQLLMDPKNTISTTGTNGEKGTGMGLLLCKELIEKHKGTLHIESEVGKGSTFIVSLPS